MSVRPRLLNLSMLAPMLGALALWLLPALARAAGSDTGQFERAAAQGPLMAVGAAFVAGLVASLTPCVWPMVPITVSIFGATEEKSRSRALLLSATFVFGIVCMFTPMGVLAGLSGKLMGAALARPSVVIGIALVFFALASSMFGAFEMGLPASLQNKMSTQGGVGFKGAFILGLLMGLIAAPCTGPFLTGLLAYIASTRDMMVGGSAMAAFACGLGVPFFAAGGFAVNLPKGGAWMMGIKWASGLVLAYMGLATLRDRWPGAMLGAFSASSAMHVGLIALLVVGLGLGLAHIAAERRKSPLKPHSTTFKLASILPAVLGLYGVLSWSQVQAASAPAPVAALGEAPAIHWQTDEGAALAEARAASKPVIIDFGATWCAACKELEHLTFPAPAVRAEATRFVALHVDGTDDEAPVYAALAKKYHVTGLPVVILLDGQGKEVARYNEFVGAEPFATALKGVK